MGLLYVSKFLSVKLREMLLLELEISAAPYAAKRVSNQAWMNRMG